jgi:hypothetical protein
MNGPGEIVAAADFLRHERRSHNMWKTFRIDVASQEKPVTDSEGRDGSDMPEMKRCLANSLFLPSNGQGER